MKKIFNLLGLMVASSGLFAQAITTEPAEFAPTDSVMFIIDINACTNQSLLNHDPEDVYLWTWLPEEANRPTQWAQGSWTNSNPNLKMKYLGDNRWGFKMVPVAFYGVDAGTCYEKDFKMLAKAKDGSAQSEDLGVEIDPPFTGPERVTLFPNKVKKDTVYLSNMDVMTFTYDHKVEVADTASTLGSATAFSVNAIAKTKDGATIRVSPLGQVGSNPALSMKADANDVFTFTFIPNMLFKSVLPTGKEIASIQLQIIRTVSGFPAATDIVKDPALLPGGYFTIITVE